jgi:ATP-dependent RNA helicase DeaD
LRFNEFNFEKELLRGIRVAKFYRPSPIQEKVIPIIQDGYDLIAEAETGTGKTAGFGLPIIDKIAKDEIERALIITPTRELAIQISDELFFLGRFCGIRTLSVFGGVSYGRQIALINRGVAIIVATPGRLKDLYRNGKIDNFNPEIVVLDEADEMLDMGFLDDIKEIFEYIPQNRQTLLFSATIPKEIRDLAGEILFEPKIISIEKKKRLIKQKYCVIDERKRDIALTKLLEIEDINKCIIFCRTKREVDRLSTYLQSLGFNAKGIHGSLEQIDREEIIKLYRDGSIKIMVATDIASRGLDIRGITHVFNYNIPLDLQSYIHRIGRTGRAGKTGKAFTLVSIDEIRELDRIKKGVGEDLEHIRIQYIDKEIDYTTLENIIKDIEIEDRAVEFLENISIDKDEFLKKIVTLLLNIDISQSVQIGYDLDTIEKLRDSY